MTIVFTGGGSGGHFYPLVAIAEAIRDTVHEERLVEPRLYYLASEPFDAPSLFENGIVYIKIPAGKVRRYFSLLNFTGFFATFIGFAIAIITLYRLYPDVVVSKGGYPSVPVTMAARFLRIPVRKELLRLEREGAREFLHLEKDVPTILVLGGSLGAKRINDVVLSASPELVRFANIIHQTGPKLFAEVESTAKE